MKHWALGAFAISMILNAPASAREQNKDDEQAEDDKEDQDDAAKASEAKAETGKAKAADAHDDPAPPAGAKSSTSAPQRAPVYGQRGDWFFAPYGYARLDAIEDSTQSFEDGIGANLISRVGTYRGDHRRTTFTARDSRLGLFVGAPTYGSVKSSAVIELDFYGLVPSDARRHDSVVFGPLRIRHAYLKLETPIVDVIAGQYYDVFGWGSYFYPASVGYLGVPGLVYHRNPQLRLEKKVHLGDLEIMAAAAAVRPGQRDSGLPDGQAGLKIGYNGWSGAAMPGFGRPTLSPLSIGVSGIYRSFEVPAFRADPGSESVKTHGYGVTASALLPVIPVKNINDRGNALTLTGEFSIGTGIADMYGIDGGSRFPLLPNPLRAAPAVQYAANVDPGLVTFDRALEIKTINWQAFVAGLQYYLPIAQGRVWLTGIYSRVWSDNIKALTPAPSWGGIFTKMEYIDANLGFEITPSVVLGLSLQTVKQTFGDVSPPTPIYGETASNNMLGTPVEEGTGGIAANARNNRAQLSMALFF